MGLRSSINRNLTDIVELHEELLGELHRVVPDSEYTQIEIPPMTNKPAGRGHQRLRSLDSVPEDDRAISWLQTAPGMISEAQIAGDVAKVFSRKASGTAITIVSVRKTALTEFADEPFLYLRRVRGQVRDDDQGRCLSSSYHAAMGQLSKGY